VDFGLKNSSDRDLTSARRLLFLSHEKVAQCDVFTCATARLCLLKEFCVCYHIFFKIVLTEYDTVSVIKNTLTLLKNQLPPSSG
jgi:hypothetical protein